MSKNDTYSEHKKLLKDLFKRIYKVKTFHYDEDEDEFVISLGSEDGIISKFNLVKDTYLEHFKLLLSQTFRGNRQKPVRVDRGLKKSLVLHDPSDADGMPQKDYIDFVARALRNISGDTLEKVLAVIVKDNASHQKRYVPTTDSLFDVMEHYSDYKGVPMLCTEEQLPECKARFENKYVSAAETDMPTDKLESMTIEEFFHKYPDAAEYCGEQLGTLLTDVMLPVFSKADISKEELDEAYNSALERIKSDLTEQFENEARSKLYTSVEDDTKRIVIVDQSCPIDELGKMVLYYPDCSPVLSDWKTPVHSYIKYRAPEYTTEDIKDVLLHPARLNSRHFPLGDLQADGESLLFPISSIKVPYCQSRFDNFQIQYMTSKSHFQSDPLFLICNIDYEISREIQNRWSDQVEEHWKMVLESIDEIVQKLSEIEWIPLIQEQWKIVTADMGYMECLNQYLQTFCQPAAVQYDENTFTAFFPQELLQRHYFIQHCKSPSFAVLFGEDFAAEYSMQQVSYVLIPLIGSFVCELKKNMYAIAPIIGELVSKKQFDAYTKQIERCLNSVEWDKAIQEWDTVYSNQKKNVLLQNRCSVKDGTALNPDYRHLALLEYTDQNGNLIRNLKSTLEEYLYCLQELC